MFFEGLFYPLLSVYALCYTINRMNYWSSGSNASVRNDTVDWFTIHLLKITKEMKTKICCGCKERKSIKCFYIRLNGWINYLCKGCEVLRRHKYLSNPEKRKRNNLVSALYKRKDRKENPKKYLEQNRERYKRYPEKMLAKTKVWEAIRKGLLKKEPCVVCGEIKVHGHHPDYSKPLEVIWLCHTHHKQLHLGKIKL